MIRANVSGAPPILGSTGSTTIALASILVVVGIAMICTAVWLVRATRTDSPALGPLEVMGDRSWRRRDAAARARSLDAARPEGALPPAPILERDPDDPPPMTGLPPELVASEEVAAEVEAAAEEPVADGAVEEPVAEAPSTNDANSTDDTRVDVPQPVEQS